MQRNLCFASLALSILSLIVLIVGLEKPRSQNLGFSNTHHNIVDRMPLILDDPFKAMAEGGAPQEQRGVEYRKWLSAGLRINVKGAAGSGTIVYYDPKEGWAYVQSCGHLWNGNMSAKEGQKKRLTCQVTTWYHNMKKLTEPKNYPAQVLYYSNVSGEDCSLLRFKPDWVPYYFPIAPDFEFKQGLRLHSVGCDGAREVAHYDVRVIGIQGADLVTTENSPRPGRSGGGLMSDSYYVGICWGTSDYDGDGNGFFTPLDTLRRLNAREGFGWLNEVGFNLARKIPIIDRNNPQGQYPRDYIPLPHR